MFGHYVRHFLTKCARPLIFLVKGRPPGSGEAPWVGRITVSIPNELEATLDAYAEEHHQAVSHIVTRALRMFFENPPDPADPPDLAATQRYLTLLIEQLELGRQSLHQVAIAQSGAFAAIPDALSQPLPEPPWKDSRPRSDEE